MGRCDGCEYEYDGLCTEIGRGCNEIVVCNVVTHKVRERMSKTPTIGKEETEMEKTEQDKQDNVNHPKHYEGHCSIECIDNMRLIFGNQNVTDYCMVNAYKYLSRYRYKNGYEDLKKAKWYLDKAEVLHLTEGTDINCEMFDKLFGLCNKYMEEYEHGKGNE
mgnify:CR=1 FL=1